MNRHERRRAQAAARAFDKRVERDRVDSRRSPQPAMLGIVQKRIEQIMTTDGITVRCAARGFNITTGPTAASLLMASLRS